MKETLQLVCHQNLQQKTGQDETYHEIQIAPHYWFVAKISKILKSTKQNSQKLLTKFSNLSNAR